MSSALQLTRRGVGRRPAGAALDALAAAFATARVLRLPRLFDADLLALLQRHLAAAAFTTRIAHGVYPPAVDLKLRDDHLHGVLHFLLNDPAVVATVQHVAGVPEIGGFVGAVYRLLPGAGHRDSWHDDADGNRRVALTVNLSEAPFEGGEFQLREKAGRPLATIANTGPGDGVLFAIDPSLEHCIAPMRGVTPKTALAGWFCVDPSR
ncbi:MAG: 2OG-Fe(II) oxygenase [Vicinamibacterales bacterium]|nr:2OG-Fe(II) oxygenase [Vicinamibacterales bacterium]